MKEKIIIKNEIENAINCLQDALSDLDNLNLESKTELEKELYINVQCANEHIRTILNLI